MARHHEHPPAYGGRCSWLFGWVSPMVATGYSRQLQDSDLPPPPPGASPAECGDALWRQWVKELSHAAPDAPRFGAAPAPRPRRRPSLLRALAAAYGSAYFPLALLKALNDGLMLLMPLLLKQLVQQIDSAAPPSDPPPSPPTGAAAAAAAVFLGPNAGYVWAGLLGLAAAAKAVLGAHYEYRMNVVSNRLRAGLMACLHTQALLTRAADAAGGADAATLMGVDAGRVVNLVPSFQELWSLPIQLAVAMWLLYTQVRFAFVAGVALCVAMLPVNRALAGRIQAASLSMMGHKDARVRLMGEMLHGIRVVKVMSLEPAFVARIGGARELELQQLAVRKYLDALCVYFWAATQLLFSALTFGLMALLGQPLKPSVVFTSLALFNMLIAPLKCVRAASCSTAPRRAAPRVAIPWVINGVVEAFVSVRRLQAFLTLPQRSASWTSLPAPGAAHGRGAAAAARPPPGLPAGPAGAAAAATAALEDPGREEERHVLQREGAVAVFEKASFAWSHNQRPVLSDLTLALPAGRLTVVVGQVGSGKSSLLAALLGEVELWSGRALVDRAAFKGRGGAGYVGQAPWVVGGTIRDNVLLGEPYEPGWMREVLHATALDTDLAALPAGDLTRIGDRGSTLSGGQRQRLALARALYRRCSVYLLDDVLSAVDNHCAQWLIRHVLLGGLITSGRPDGGGGGGGGGGDDPTVVLVTKSAVCIQAAEQVLALENGRLAFAGDPRDYAQWKGERTPPPGAAAANGAENASGSGSAGGAGEAATDARGLAAALAGAIGDAATDTPAPGCSADAEAVTLDDNLGRAPSSAADEDVDPRELRRASDGEVIWQPHASEAPQLESIQEAGEGDGDGDDAAAADAAASAFAPATGGAGQPLDAAVAVVSANDGSKAAAEGAVDGGDAEEKGDGEGREGEEEEEEEERAAGAVKWPVYRAYLGAVGWPMVAAVVLSLGLMQVGAAQGAGARAAPQGWASKNGTDLFVAHWISRANADAGVAGGGSPLRFLPWGPVAAEPGLRAALWSPTAPAVAPLWPLWIESIGSGASTALSLADVRRRLLGPGPGHAAASAHADLSDGIIMTSHVRDLLPPLDDWARGFLTGLAVLAGANTLFTLARAFAFAVAGMAAARRTHDGLLRAVMLAPAAFFDRHSVGRILNRFSSDVSTVDDSLPFILNILLANAASLAGLLAVLAYTQPALLLAMAPLALLYRRLQRYYRATSRELRRLEAAARSPLYGALGDATHGAINIRAFRAQAAFARAFTALMDPYQRATLAGAAASSWLSLRLQLLAAALVAA
ncbi:hypothetical protein MNEG_7291, partial [Monoraphidium neglectum]